MFNSLPPWYMWFDGVAGAAVLSIVAFVVKRLWFKSDRAVTSAPSGNAPIHIEVNPVITNSPTTNQTTFPTQINQQQNSVQDAAELGPKLTAVRYELASIYWNRVQWEKKAGTLPIGIILWVSNEPAAYGEKNEPVRSAVATMVYKSNGSTVQHVSRAFWLNESANEIFLNVGDRKGLIAAAVPLAGNVWMAYTNPRQQEWRAPTRVSQSFNFPPVPQQQFIEFGEELEIDVTIVSLATMQTVLKCQLLISRGEEEEIEISME